MSEDRDLPRDDTGRITIDYEPTPLEIKVCRDAICREFGNNGTDGYYIRILKAVHAASAARPSHTGEKVEAVAWRWKGHAGAWVYEEGNLTKREMRKYDGVSVEDLYIAATLTALVAERDEAQSKTAYLEEEIVRIRDVAIEHNVRATAAESALAAANARVERLADLVKRAQQNISGVYSKWHADARAALEPPHA